jgi:hypothetical protein
MTTELFDNTAIISSANRRSDCDKNQLISLSHWAPHSVCRLNNQREINCHPSQLDTNFGNTQVNANPFQLRDTSWVFSNYISIENTFVRTLKTDINPILTEIVFRNRKIESWLKVSNIISNILQKQELGNIEHTLDYIFDTFDDLIIEQKFDIINLLFDIIEINDLYLESIVGLLTITSSCSDEIRSRNTFYNKAYKIINEKYLTEETNQILGGLE